MPRAFKRGIAFSNQVSKRRSWLMLIALGLCFLMSMNATFRSIDQDGYLPKTLLATTDQFGDNQTARCTDFLCFFVFLVINS
jgi:hypothetical protein